MKPMLSPLHTTMLEQAIDLIDAVYAAGWTDLDSPFHMGKLSTARGDLTFVLESTRRHGPAQVIVLEREGVTV